jgi:hypothetical protein
VGGGRAVKPDLSNGSELKAHLARVEERLGAAVAAAERLRERVGEGRAGEAADIAELRSFAEALESAGSVAEAFSDGGGTPNSVEELRSMVERIEAEGRRHERLIAALRTAADLEEGRGAAVKACRDVARDLCESGDLDDPEARRQAEGLLALIELNSSPETVDRDELERQAVENLSQECIPAVGLAQMGMLAFATVLSGETNPTSSGELVEPEELAAPEAGEPIVAQEEESEPPDRPEQESDAPEEKDHIQPTAPEPPARAPSEDEVEKALTKLLREGRFGLAYWVTVSSEGNPGLAKSLAALAYADAMRSPVGESAGRLRELIEELTPDELHGDKTARRIALIAGLRATLLAPHSGAAGLLEAVATSFSKPSGLERFVEAVADAGRRGLLATGVTLHARNIATTEDDLAAVQARAREMLKERTIKYQRASNVWRTWVGEDGLLGRLLSDVVANRAERLEEVESKVFDLRSAKMLEKELDVTDRALRAAGRKNPITDKARLKLIEGAEEALGIAADWVDVSRRLEQVRQVGDSAAWQKSLLKNLRSVTLEARSEIAAEWDEWSSGSGLPAAAAVGTRSIIDEVFDLVVEGKSPEGSERQVDEILGLDLLRVEGLEVDDRLIPPEIPPLEPLLRAIDCDWEDAFGHRVKEASFGVAARIVEVLRRESPEDADRLESTRLEQLEEERRHLNGRLDEGARALESARRQGRLREQDALSLSNDLNELVLDGDDEELAGADDAIFAFEAKLSEAERAGQEIALERYRDRLADDSALQPYRERFERLLEAGEISTLEELVLAVERGHEPPSEPAALFRQLTSFFPSIVDDPNLAGLPIPAGLAEIARERGSIGAVSFAGLRDEEIGVVGDALVAWQRMAAKDVREADSDLARILDFLGLTVKQELDLRISSREQRSYLVNAQPFGKALTPAFGSEAKGMYRVLPVWGQTTDDALVGTISQQAGKEPIVALCFGTVLKSDTRRGIADQFRHSRTSRPVALIDNAAFLYLASRGGRDLTATMRITLPFTAINPYRPFVAGSVPLEMFYGRHEELAEVMSPTGTSFIYGGRRLGKSALLRAAEREVNAEDGEHKAIYVDLKSNGIGEWRAAEEISDVITKALIEADVMTSTAAKSESLRFALLRDQVKAWIGNEPGRRILLLLDECDSFLNADAENGFRNVSQLKSLMEETDRMFKPVFAGLHQVNRFQRMPNQPLAHLGVQMPVGPLTPQRAYELITKPMEALGYRFEGGSGLPERILTATNYQPSLIQIFCSELVKHMLDKHARGPNTPPYVVTSEDVEHVYQTPHVVEEMRGRFELTINLDPRYRVIAYVVALEAREGGVSVGLAPPEIKAACEEYWPAGFAKTSSDEFRTLLEEMDSLGILFKRDGTFLMRSPNVLRMLGTSEQIEERLYDAADELEIEQGFEATSFRDAIGKDGYRRRPLTHQQVAGMIVRQQQRVHVVVGSRATGIDDVYPCLKSLFEGDAAKYNFVDVTGQDAKRVANRFRKPAHKKHRVVHYRIQPDLANNGLDLIHAVEERVFRGAGPSTAIFVVGSDTMPTWRAVVAPTDDRPEGEAGDGLPRFELVELRRWTEAGLRAWAQSQEVDLPFHEKQALREITKATGGWPMLVDQVVQSYKPNRNWPQAIEELETWLREPEGASSFCEAVGLLADPALRAAWEALIELGEPVERELFQELIDVDPDRAAATSVLLRSMQVIDFDGGRFMPEPTAARAWQTMTSQPDARA